MTDGLDEFLAGVESQSLDRYQRETLVKARHVIASAYTTGVATERERCAKLADDHLCSGDCTDYGLGPNCDSAIAKAIREAPK